MDVIVLKPMDDLFDLMTNNPTYNKKNFQNSTMWIDNMENYDHSVDFLFTRDYNMVHPPRKEVHQIGTQGGFLVIRPSLRDFENFVNVIVHNNTFVPGAGWGGNELGYGGYYGAATIQGTFVVFF
jgi:hypothetical protein